MSLKKLETQIAIYHSRQRFYQKRENARYSFYLYQKTTRALEGIYNQYHALLNDLKNREQQC